jgi:glycosyltransferase involved in cell wall biosynthesis
MKISVYITSYNQRDYLKEAVDSVLQQTRLPDQIVIVDDASQDGSRDLIREYASQYPHLVSPIFHQHNLGVVASRLDALSSVKGDCVTYLDGDDRFLPEKLEREAGALEKDDQIGIIYSNFRFINADGDNTGNWNSSGMLPEGMIFLDVFGRRFPRNIVFRNELVRSELLRNSSYDPALNLYEDWDLRIRLTRTVRVACCPEVLSEYRLHAESLSQAHFADHISAIDSIVSKNRNLLEDFSRSDKRYVIGSIGRWRKGIVERAVIGLLDAPAEAGDSKRNPLPLWKYFSFHNRIYLPWRLAARVILGRRLYQKIVKSIKEVL